MKCIAVVALFAFFAVALAKPAPEDLKTAESAVFYNAPGAAVYPYAGAYAGAYGGAYGGAYAPAAYRYATPYAAAAYPTYYSGAATPYSYYGGAYKTAGAYVPNYYGLYNGYV